MQLASLAIPVYAQELPEELTKIEIGSSSMGGFVGMSKLTVGGVIGWLIGVVMALAAIIFFFILITGGIKWLTSGGDEKSCCRQSFSYQRPSWFGYSICLLGNYETTG